jgi:hypothetical protein
MPIIRSMCRIMDYTTDTNHFGNGVRDRRTHITPTHWSVDIADLNKVRGVDPMSDYLGKAEKMQSVSDCRF